MGNDSWPWYVLVKPTENRLTAHFLSNTKARVQSSNTFEPPEIGAYYI